MNSGQSKVCLLSKMAFAHFRFDVENGKLLLLLSRDNCCILLYVLTDYFENIPMHCT